MKTKYCLSILFLLVLANHFCFAQDTTLTKKQLRKKQREYSVGVLGTFENYPLETTNVISNRVKVDKPSYYTVIGYVDAKDLPYKPSYAFGYGLTYQQNLPIISPNFIVGANFSYGSKGTYYYSDLGYGYGDNVNRGLYISYHHSKRNQKTNYYYKPELFFGFKKQLNQKLNVFANFGTGVYLFKKIISEEYDFINGQLISRATIYNRLLKEPQVKREFNGGVLYQSLFAYGENDLSELKNEVNFKTFFLQTGFNYSLSKNIKASLSLYIRKERRKLPIPVSYEEGLEGIRSLYYSKYSYQYLYHYKKTDVQLTTQISINYAF